MEIIGMSGFARAGKDEAAKVLVEQHGFERVAFADKLREVLYALNPTLVGWFEPGQDAIVPQVKLQEVIDEYGWDGYKETPFGPEIRRLLQRLGTEAGRQTMWDSIWIDAAFANLDENAKVVVTDARFINEFEAIRSRGGYVWRIDRANVGVPYDHPSETEALTYEHFSLFLQNNGTLEEFRELVAREYTRGLYKEWI